jgi:hypothetical protein
MRKLFLLLCILGGSLQSVNVFASSAGPVIFQLQTQGATSQTSYSSIEYISVRNDSAQDVDVTNWCIVYASSSDATQTQLTCLTPPSTTTKLWLRAGGYITLSTQEFITSHPGFVPDAIFNAGIAASAGHVKLIDAQKNSIDKLGWGSAVNPEGQAHTAHTPGTILERTGADSDNNKNDFVQTTLTILPTSDLYEEEVPVDICPNTPELDLMVPIGFMKDTDGNCYEDQCDNVAGLQKNLPPGYYKQDIDCHVILLRVNELLPNAISYDTGKEFIELFNPSAYPVSLSGYMLQIDTKTVSLPDYQLAPNAYVVLSDTQTTIVLPNTSGSVRLLGPDGAVIDESSPYTNPLDNQSWSLIDEIWQYTNQPTPGVANISMTLDEASGETPDDTTVITCPAGKYRNPLTGRCKNIEAHSLAPCDIDEERNPATGRCRSIFSSIGGLTPCQPGQIRNPETNRCRSSVTAAAANLTPCQPGQERNPETNRCRKIQTAVSQKPCPEGQVRNPETNRCRKSPTDTVLQNITDHTAPQASSGFGWLLTSSAVAGFGGYALWEWRVEVLAGIRRILAFFGKTPPEL